MGPLQYSHPDRSAGGSEVRGHPGRGDDAGKKGQGDGQEQPRHRGVQGCGCPAEDLHQGHGGRHGSYPGTAKGLARYHLPIGAIIMVNEEKGWAGKRFWRKFRERPPRPRTSPAVCPGWRNSLKSASLKRMHSHGNRRYGLLRAVPQRETEGDHHSGDRGVHGLLHSKRQTRERPRRRLCACRRTSDGRIGQSHDILRIRGIKELAKYLVDEVQEVYRLQGSASTTSTLKSLCGRC